MPQEISAAIAEMVRGIPAIREAYLPQCFVQALVDPPAQILVLVLDDPADQKTLDAVGQGLEHILPPGMHLDVWPLDPGHNLLSTIRQTRMQPGIAAAPVAKQKPWWKIFG